ncbi:hypothetical protein Q8A73_005499 [Channa argus]|nr:hypothetical protein Q8A73_005499 [Channa argus]
MSIPVQCTQEIPVYFHEKPQPLAAAAHNPAPQCADWRHMGTFSNLLAEDMARLSVGVPQQRKEDLLLEPKVASLLSLDSTMWQAASTGEYEIEEQTDNFNRDGTLHATKMPVTDGSSLVDFLSQPDGLLMSDVALQSNMCEFCQAVFPGDTTTRGEFLRHLHTHVT